MWMNHLSPRTLDRLPELSGLHVQLSEVCKTMVGTCGPYNSGGSAIAGIRACYIGSATTLLVKTSKWFCKIKVFEGNKLKMLLNLPYACCMKCKGFLVIQIEGDAKFSTLLQQVKVERQTSSTRQIESQTSPTMFCGVSFQHSIWCYEDNV
jgi:hypothetical protein